MKQANLFIEPQIDGLQYAECFVEADEHDQLVSMLDQLDLAPFRFHGWVGNRKTLTYGWRYDFEDSTFAPAEPIPDWLEPLRLRAAAFAGVQSEDVAHALLARYDPGAGIGWHRDRPQFDKVIGISLGSVATMRFRRRIGGGFRRTKLGLEPRSAYLLDGEARADWEHSISAGQALRFSITFRTLSCTGFRIARQDGWPVLREP